MPDWITLRKPLPPTGESVITFRRETRVVLAINFDQIPIQRAPGYDGIKIPPTASVRNYADTTGKTLLEFRIRLYGATTKQYYKTACPRCERRQGKRKGPPGMIDFHTERDIIEPKDGKIHVAFTFCCYPKDRQLGDTEYLLEVVFSEDEDQDRIVAKCCLPFTFNVLSRLPPALGQKPTAQRKRKRVDLEQAGGATLAPEAPFARPRLNDANVLVQRNPSSIEQIHHPVPAMDHQSPLRSVQSHDGGPFNLPRNAGAISEATAPPRIDVEPTPTLTEVNPEARSITGGARIWLKGMNFPSSLPLFARFGTTVVPTTFSASNLLTCHLPAAAVPGIVDVTLSKGPQTNTPEYGISIAKFEYLEDQPPILRRNRGQGYCRPRSDSDRSILSVGTAYLSPRENCCCRLFESSQPLNAYYISSPEE